MGLSTQKVMVALADASPSEITYVKVTVPRYPPPSHLMALLSAPLPLQWLSNVCTYAVPTDVVTDVMKKGSPSGSESLQRGPMSQPFPDPSSSAS